MAETVNPASQEAAQPQEPQPRRPARFSPSWLAFLVVGAALMGGIAWMVLGRSGPAPEIAQARELLQVNKFQAAADLLASQKSAEGQYLKAVALNGLRQRDAALDAAHKAHDLEPTNPRYEGFLLLLRMAKEERGMADELIELYEQNRSIGSLALFASSAHLMKRDQPKSMATFDVAAALANEAPEFMFQTLEHAVQVGRRRTAEQLIEKLSNVRGRDPEVLRNLLRVAVRGRLGKSSEMLLGRLKELTPDDPDLEKVRVEVLLFLNKPDALAAAEKLYLDRGETEEAAMLYVQPLSQAPVSPETDRRFVALARRFPRNMEIFARHALYLARAGREEESLEMIDRMLSSTSLEPSVRAHLLQLAIGLPLEKERADLLEREMERHRSELTDPQFIAYLRGRIHAMRKEYEAALVEFKKVIQAEKARSETPRTLAADALVQVRKILAEQRISEQLGKVAETIERLDEKKPVEPGTNRE